ncbi:hypothetical protein CJF30_00005164 [Rutstroemia sp. NJR-2017a BBW]|nr:hypothetical protein CJF30_00005164 [Rutstroemia sp. NJR-2017a BBW]
MPISKKDRIQREHKKAEKAGTRAPVKANGLPVKAAKPMVQCKYCRKELDKTNVAILKTHAESHADKGWTPQKCWPEEFPA